MRGLWEVALSFRAQSGGPSVPASSRCPGVIEAWSADLCGTTLLLLLISLSAAAPAAVRTAPDLSPLESLKG